MKGRLQYSRSRRLSGLRRRSRCRRWPARVAEGSELPSNLRGVPHKIAADLVNGLD